MAFRGEMSPANEISLPEAYTHTSFVFVSLHGRHFSNQCDICNFYKVAKMGHRNWSHNHCNRSDTKLSMFTTTRAILTELYTQVPSLSRTHTYTHTPNTLYALTQCAAFFVHLLFSCCCFLFCFLNNSQYMYLIECWFFSPIYADLNQ